MVRISTGKRSMSASEKEEKGKGQRIKTKKKLLYEEDFDSAVESSSSSDQSFPQIHETASVPKKTSQNFTWHSTFSIINFSSFFQNSRSYTITTIYKPHTTYYSFNVFHTFNIFYPFSFISKIKSRHPISSFFLTPGKVQNCHFPNKKHQCPFQDGNVTLASVGQTLCDVSSKFTWVWCFIVANYRSRKKINL